MIVGNEESIDLSNVVDSARECHLDAIHSSTDGNERLLKVMFESVIATFGLYIKLADHWSFQFGLLMNKALQT